jgi:hypothetical protein
VLDGLSTFDEYLLSEISVYNILILLVEEVSKICFNLVWSRVYTFSVLLEIPFIFLGILKHLHER